MVLNGDTNKSLAAFLNISERSVNDKINSNGTEFRQSEITAIKERYSLTPEKVDLIFFN
jgi:FixJ family two-component response regulator